MIRKSITVSLLLLPLSINQVMAADTKIIGEAPQTIKPVQPAIQPISPTQLSKDPVSFSWAISSDATVDILPSANVSTSKEYWIRVSGEELSQGVSLPTSAAGALVKINPLMSNTENTSILQSQNTAKSINPTLMTLMTQEGRSFSQGQGMSLMASSDQLQGQGSPFAEGTSIFQIRNELGAGRFTLSTNNTGQANQAFAVHVREKDSPIALKMQANKRDLLSGDNLTVSVKLEQQGLALASQSVAKVNSLNSVKGLARSPSGEVFPMTFTKQANGEFLGSLALANKVASSVQGLWEVETSTTGKTNSDDIWRNGKLVFSLAKPTASLVGKTRSVFKGDKPESVSVKLRVKDAGRYEVRGILFGTNDAGEMKPMMVSQSANYLEKGRQTINLQFDQSIIANSNLKAPYKLQGVRLIDQGQMGVLEELSEGFDIR